jgi:hypothetical protein
LSSILVHFTSIEKKVIELHFASTMRKKWWSKNKKKNKKELERN